MSLSKKIFYGVYATVGIIAGLVSLYVGHMYYRMAEGMIVAGVCLFLVLLPLLYMVTRKVVTWTRKTAEFGRGLFSVHGELISNGRSIPALCVLHEKGCTFKSDTMPAPMSYLYSSFMFEKLDGFSLLFSGSSLDDPSSVYEFKMEKPIYTEAFCKLVANQKQKFSL